jgi:hypothetical protein
MESGAPMLILPPHWAGGTVGDHVVIAWNGGRRPRRARRHAVP